MKKIILVGSINTDLVITSPYIPKAGETLSGSGFFVAHGGKGANQAIAASRLGGKVYMCGCVGNDEFGTQAIKSLQDNGVDCSFIRKTDGVPTGTAVIIVTDGNNRIILDHGANAELKEDDIDKALEVAEEGDVYLTQLENPVNVIGYGLKRAKEKGLCVVLNPAPANKEIIPFIQYADIITPNETESEILGGKEKLLETAKRVIITLGGKGYEIADKRRSKTYGCMKVDVVDTTAAGDTLCGGLSVKLAEGETIEEAAAFGSLAASIACTKKGAEPSIPTVEDIKEFIKKRNG